MTLNQKNNVTQLTDDQKIVNKLLNMIRKKLYLESFPPLINKNNMTQLEEKIYHKIEMLLNDFKNRRVNFSGAIEVIQLMFIDAVEEERQRILKAIDERICLLACTQNTSKAMSILRNAGQYNELHELHGLKYVKSLINKSN